MEHHPPEPEVRRTRKTKHRSSKLLAIGGGVTNISGKSGKKKKRVENSMFYLFFLFICNFISNLFMKYVFL